MSWKWSKQRRVATLRSKSFKCLSTSTGKRLPWNWTLPPVEISFLLASGQSWASRNFNRLSDVTIRHVSIFCWSLELLSPRPSMVMSASHTQFRFLCPKFPIWMISLDDLLFCEAMFDKTTFVSRLRAILRQVFATHVCFSGRTAIPSYQERSSVGMGVRRESSFSSAEGALIYSQRARSFWSIPSIRSRLRCISSWDRRYLVSPLFWQKWTTNSQHFQDAHSKSAQLQPDTKRSIGHHLRLEEILPIFIWKKVYFSDGPPAFSGHVRTK